MALVGDGLTLFARTVAVSGAGGATVTGPWARVPASFIEGAAVLDLTAIGGTVPVYTVTVTHSHDGGTLVADVKAFTPSAGASDQQETFTSGEWIANHTTLRRFVRATVVVTGTDPTAVVTVRVFPRST